MFMLLLICIQGLWGGFFAFIGNLTFHNPSTKSNATLMVAFPEKSAQCVWLRGHAYVTLLVSYKQVQSRGIEQIKAALRASGER